MQRAGERCLRVAKQLKRGLARVTTIALTLQLLLSRCGAIRGEVQAQAERVLAGESPHVTCCSYRPYWCKRTPKMGSDSEYTKNFTILCQSLNIT